MSTRTQRKRPVPAARRKRNLPHLAGRLFGVPLLVDARKLDAVVPAFLRRLQGDVDDDDTEIAGETRDADEPIVDQNTGIAVIPVIGSLVRRPSMMDMWSGLTSYADIECALQCALDDARVRGILLQIDTFGGEAGGCFELCDKIYAARNVKPIWAVADIEALSAGYAIASSASQLFVAGRGHVGSIGVVTVHLERSKQNEMLGLTYTVLRAGERKADFNPYEELSAEAAAKQLEYIERTRQTFAQTVSRNRSMLTLNDVLATEGDFYDAQDAVEMRLVDGIGSYESVFEQLTAQVAASTSRPAVPPPEPPAPAVDEDDDPEPDSLPLPAASREVTMDKTTKPGENTTMVDAKPVESAAATPPTTPTLPVTPPAIPTPPVAAAAGDNVVQLDAARPVDAAREIAELCTIAGRKELCADFLAEGLSVGDVRKRLIDMKAQASNTTGEVSNHQPAKATGNLTAPTLSTPSPEALSTWDNAFARVHAGDPRFASGS